MADGYRLVVNCATREKDLAWMNTQAKSFDVKLSEKPDAAMIAVQGPDARSIVNGLLGAPQLDSLGVFAAVNVEYSPWHGSLRRVTLSGVRRSKKKRLMA